MALERTPVRSMSLQEVTCFGCKEVITTNTVVLEAMGQSWHMSCFRCRVCQTPLPEHYYEEKGEPFCKNHFYSTLAHKCRRCLGYITGPTMTAGFRRMYHPECFICFDCFSPIGENDTYSLLSSGKILCNDCCQEVDSESDVSSFTGGVYGHSDVAVYTSVQMVKVSLRKKVKFRLEGEVPVIDPHHHEPHQPLSRLDDFTAPQLPCPGERASKTNTLRIEKLPRSLANSPLRSGDEILEINGIVIVNQDQDEINKLMQACQDCLYLTIERRKPSYLSKSSHSTTSIESTVSRRGRESEEITHIEREAGEKTNDGDEDCDGGNMQDTTDSGAEYTDSVVKPSKRRRTRSIPAQDFSAEYIRCFRLSDLEIGEVLGHGFYGTVTKVVHRHTRQMMVMKEMVNCTDEAKKTFAKEVQLLKSLNHPNILHFIGILYKEGKLLNLIMEYVEGGTLRKTIKNQDKPFPWELRIQIARDIAAGMCYLHSQGVIHRDLNTKNCLLRQDMTAVVADFGLARVFNPIESKKDCSDSNLRPARNKRKRMTVVGSPYHMAPEMLRGEQYNEMVDVFSYGIVLCEIIARVKADPDQLPRQHNFGLDESEFRTLCCDCPPPLYNLAVECCSLNCEERPDFHSCEQGLNILLAIAHSNRFNLAQLEEKFACLFSMEASNSGSSSRAILYSSAEDGHIQCSNFSPRSPTNKTNLIMTL